MLSSIRVSFRQVTLVPQHDLNLFPLLAAYLPEVTNPVTLSIGEGRITQTRDMCGTMYLESDTKVVRKWARQRRLEGHGHKDDQHDNHADGSSRLDLRSAPQRALSTTDNTRPHFEQEG